MNTGNGVHATEHLTSKSELSGRPKPSCFMSFNGSTIEKYVVNICQHLQKVFNHTEHQLPHQHFNVFFLPACDRMIGSLKGLCAGRSSTISIFINMVYDVTYHKVLYVYTKRCTLEQPSNSYAAQPVWNAQAKGGPALPISGRNANCVIPGD